MTSLISILSPPEMRHARRFKIFKILIYVRLNFNLNGTTYLEDLSPHNI